MNYFKYYHRALIIKKNDARYRASKSLVEQSEEVFRDIHLYHTLGSGSLFLPL